MSLAVQGMLKITFFANFLGSRQREAAVMTVRFRRLTPFDFERLNGVAGEHAEALCCIRATGTRLQEYPILFQARPCTVKRLKRAGIP